MRIVNYIKHYVSTGIQLATVAYSNVSIYILYNYNIWILNQPTYLLYKCVMSILTVVLLNYYSLSFI